MQLDLYIVAVGQFAGAMPPRAMLLFNLCLMLNFEAVVDSSGPIAMTRNPHKVISMDNAAVGIDDIAIFDSVGKLITTIKGRAETTVVSLGWTAREDLVVVYLNGRVDV